ncbi:MAG TPA: hypothetical protein VLF66_10610 [Thermoanaerobaculia bacterium]|nr:hypothetical protein [Thermoanaerobaculia bacterium]
MAHPQSAGWSAKRDAASSPAGILPGGARALRDLVRTPGAAAVLLAAGLAVLASPPLPAQPGELTEAEAACARARIEALAARTRVEGERGGEAGAPVTVLYAPGRGSDLNGTAFSNQWRRAGDPIAQLSASPPPLTEAHLAFTVTVLRETLLNPARTPLFQVGFAREASSTNLLDPGDPRAFQLLLNPTLSAEPPAAALLRINDLALHAVSAVSSDSKPGRGLQVDRITEPCTGGYSDADLDFMGAFAQRLLRPVAWNGSVLSPRAFDVVGGVVREPEPGAYRVLLRALDPADGSLRGRLAARIEAPRTSDGGLGVGRVEILPSGTEGPARWALYAVPPVFPESPDLAGRTWSPDAPGAARVAWPGGDEEPPESAEVNWYLLLRDSAWNDLTFLKGLALSPRGFPGDFSKLPEFFAEAATFPSPAVIWNGSWREGIDAEGLREPVPLPGGALLTAERAREHRFTPLFVFGWRSGETPHLAVPGNPVNDWSNADARELYAEVVARFAAVYRPPFLFLGNESDAYFAHDPVDYARWIAAYEEAYAAVKAASPETLVGPVFQYEQLAGLGILTGVTEPRWGALEAHDLGTVDVVGITLYPFLRAARPADVPAGHLAPLFARIGATPVVVTETGWPAEAHPEAPVPWETSEAHQVTYLDRLFAMMVGRYVRGAVWLFLHPLLDDGTFDARVFGSISLRDETGAKRLVYDSWAAK